MMRKLSFALILVLLVSMCAAELACAGSAAGAWEVSVAAPSAADKTAIAKLMSSQKGVKYQLVAYLGRQTVNGTNYCVLYKATPEGKDKAAYYTLGFIHVSADGKASLLKTAKLKNVGLNSRWKLTKANPMTGAQSSALRKRLTARDGASFKWISYLGYRGNHKSAQHCILYRVTPTTPGAEPSLVLVYVNTNSGTEVKVSNMIDLDIASFAP